MSQCTMNYQMSQCTMNYHRRPATEALEHLASIRCDREIPPRATAALSSSSLKFGFTTLFDRAVSMQQQQQDSIEFPVISWSSDDERENSDYQDINYPKASSSSISSDEGEKEGLGYIYKLATQRGLSKKPQQEGSDGAYRMVRSKALHSELSLLASSISPSRSSSTQRHGVVAKIA
jgi:hypothetical protein